MIKRFFINFISNAIFNMDDSTKSKLYLSLKKAHVKVKQNEFREKYDIDKDFRFNGDEILFYGNGRIVCGKNSYIGNYSTIQAGDQCDVHIGDNCSISHNVRIYTTSNFSDQDFDTPGRKKIKNHSVIIGNGVWIGANVFINPGVVIGDNSVIGANSVVSKNIAPFGIYGGVPAKLIRYKTMNTKPQDFSGNNLLF